MTVSISLKPDHEKRLKERAAAAGKDIAAYVEDLVGRELAAPLSLVEAAEPIARAVDAAAVTDQQFADALQHARNTARQERKLKRA